MNQQSVHEEPLSSLAKLLQQDLVNLLDAEKELARQEINTKLSEIKREALLMSAGAIGGGLFLCCLVTAGILALSLTLAAWLAALVVAGVFGLTALVLFVTLHARMRRLDPVPRVAISNVKRDVQAIQEAVR